MTLWTDVCTSSSTGTGTTKTQLNGAASLSTPSQAKCLVEVVPYQAATGAYTAAESDVTRFSIESASIGTILPKVMALTPSHGGLGTFTTAAVPMLDTYRLDVRLPNANVPIDYYGQQFVLNTVAFRVGATVTYSDMPPTRKEQFYDCPAAMTATGTAAATVSGTAITVNNATALNLAYGNISITTVTASESYIGYFQVDSTDLVTIQKVRFAPQPIASGLGSNIPVIQPAGKFYNQALPIRQTATLNNSFTVEEALTGNGRFIVGIGFVR